MSEEKLLASAKHTLVNLAFFGLDEYQSLSEYLFIQTFDMNKFKFTNSISTTNGAIRNNTSFSKYINRINENNHLDIRLYEFAKKVFLKKIEYHRKSHIYKTYNGTK